ncbi:MAG: hypothetical protein JXN61_04325, partial [Sedimentisphaerales bacterium]|nr:hypothetical protein [Sedimentisphaerales bacterium]
DSSTKPLTRLNASQDTLHPSPIAQNKPNPENQKITTTSYAPKTSANTPPQSDPEKQTQTNPIQPLSPQRTPNKNHTRLARNVKIVAGATHWPPPTIPNPAKLPNKRPAKNQNY